ncbi:hypothetical protein [Wenjunlia tyrosinilytica]|uniref:DUF2029 domain-containing protein n=1 Tax=Wenjunlia tyrosinilytica TaxID=1544741 RepID=A0A917ZWJ9_9ACTN|nr:hypothetical protein [Wenjunlia tyrosinilytica]GGO95571.1 hypothetical protein GCM10012280_53070 [Wenjunlia tyrosinilytica]
MTAPLALVPFAGEGSRTAALVGRLVEGPLTRPRVAVRLSVGGTGLLALTAACAPNNHTLDVRLPLSLPFPMPGLVSTLLTFSALVLSGLGLAGMLGAAKRGWSPSPRTLRRAGVAAVAVFVGLTPVGSADMASYAAYGRIAAMGADPYVSTPADLGGAYASLVSDVWVHTPSVYGPMATWAQAGAALIGGVHPWVTIWILMIANGAVFLAVGQLLLRTCEDKVRAGLLWVANPILIGQLVAGGHLDTYMAALAVCAVHQLRRGTRLRHDVFAGVLIGLACGFKVSAVLLGAGLAWPVLRDNGPWRVVRLALTAALTLVGLYGAYGLHALAPLSAASGLVSDLSPWGVLRSLGGTVVGPAVVAAVISALWPVLMLAMTPVIRRRVLREPADTVTGPLVLNCAWLLVAPWTMPWYTAMAWALAARLPRNPLVPWLTVATVSLALLHNSGGHGWTW